MDIDSAAAVSHTGALVTVRDTTTPPSDALPPDPESYLWNCPNCGTRLQARQCKTRCQRCGFFTDCSDTGV
jgi:hypothetical protein